MYCNHTRTRTAKRRAAGLGQRLAGSAFSMIALATVFEVGGASMPDKVTAADVERFTVYHSPQTPGYTCWVGCWLMPDETLMVSFHQTTGPLSGRPMASKDIQKRLNWPRPGLSPGYDMTGTTQQIIHLASADGGRTWAKVSTEPFHTPLNGMTCEAETALPDGTIVRGVVGSFLVFYDVPQRGYFQRSTDGARSWGPPETSLDPGKMQTSLGRLEVLKDGRLVATGYSSMTPAEKARGSSGVKPAICVSADGGHTWSEPIAVLPPQEGVKLTHEFDFAELADGRLLFVIRADTPDRGRWQSLLKPEGNSFRLVRCGPAPFPYSGFPEMLAAREGVALHLATSGISWTADGGQTWHDLGIGATGYYPRAVQLPDGRVFCVFHRGGDNPYDGSVDQEIQALTFRLQVE